MRATPLTEGQRAKIDELCGRDSVPTKAAIAMMVDCTVVQVEKHIARWRIPPSPKPLLKPLTIDGDTLIVSDVHVPYHDASFLTSVIELACEWHVPTALIAGDLFNFDALSRFVRVPGTDTAKEIAIAEHIIGGLADRFKRVLLLEGNHDWRVAAKLDMEIPNKRLQRLFSLAANFEYSDFSRCFHKSGWVIGHPRAFRKVRAGLPREFADIEQMHVATAHTHNWGMVRAYNGAYYGVELGHCCDPRRLEYVQHQWKPSPKWSLGAMILKKGDDGKYHAYLLDDNSDFAALRRLYSGR